MKIFLKNFQNSLDICKQIEYNMTYAESERLHECNLKIAAKGPWKLNNKERPVITLRASTAR